MGNIENNCALCLQYGTLCNSHIISESFYVDLYDPPHKFSVIVADEKTKDNVEQKGLREYILCNDCEQLLGNQYERRGAETFRQIKKAATEDQSLTSFAVDSIDYRSFKLFQLAQLWRMAVAGHRLWHRVALPAQTLERLRVMLLDGSPSTFDRWWNSVSATGNCSHRCLPR